MRYSVIGPWGQTSSHDSLQEAIKDAEMTSWLDGNEFTIKVYDHKKSRFVHTIMGEEGPWPWDR